MDTSLWEQVEAIFSEAVELPPDRRAVFLDDACGDDDALRTEVEGLLTADTADFALGMEGELLREEEVSSAQVEGLLPGYRIGPYQIEAEVGRGGMGAVYRASRADGAFEKEVALKLVKRGMDTDEVLARFRRERQVLAALDHPGIARLLDGGAADDGRPYLVMEFIEGEPVTRYSASRRLSVEQRLALFGQVCEAVQHAHRRLVVHRDLKPSNILVTETEGGQAHVKLLDFGIARLLDPTIDEALTQPDVRRLTPAYAAPEQLRGEAVTTAADVYALGVVLYELLTGQRLPNPLKPPSAVVEKEHLRRPLQGDLDVICLKALRGEPEARYPSVEAFAEDLRRHRTGLPVQARPTSVAYRMRKFIERHRVGVAATLLVMLSVLGGFGVAVWQARTAALERDVAQREAAKSEQVTEFLMGVFEVADPRETGGRTLTAQEMLDLASTRVDAELANQPEVQGDLLDTMGRVHMSVGDYEQAEAFMRRALAVRRDAFGAEHPQLGTSLNGLAEVLRQQGRYDEAEPLYREALAIQQRVYGGEHPEEATTLDNLALLLHLTGHLDEAIELHRDALAMRQQLLAPPHEHLATSYHNLAGALSAQGDSEEAEALYREAIAMWKAVRGPGHPDVAVTLTNLGLVLRRRDDLNGAESLYREALAIYRQYYGNDHPYVAWALGSLGVVLRRRGDLDAAEPLYREALAVNRRVLGERSREVASNLNNLGKLLYTKGDYAEAESFYEEAIALWRDLYGDDYGSLPIGLKNVADARYAQGNLGGAEPLYRESLDWFRRTRPEGHVRIGSTLAGLGRVLASRGQVVQAEPMLREALAMVREASGEESAETVDAMSALGMCLAARGHYEEAEALLLASVPLLQGSFADGHVLVGQAEESLADVQAAMR